MNNQFPVSAPLGRLYDPLLQLAMRVQRALVGKEKTVWTDNNGFVFATPTDTLRPISRHATIGVYGCETPLPMIELALRRALRERASAWIVDWQAAYSLNSRRTDNHILQQFTTPRKRKRKTKTTNAEPRAVTSNVRQRTDNAELRL